jgi:hypothetical protein
MMQSTNLRNGDNSAAAWWLDLSRDRRVSLQREMRSRVQVVVGVRSKDAAQAALVDDDYMVEAFPAD